MKSHLWSIVFLFVFFFGGNVLAAPPLYRVTDLGDLPGGNSYSIAYGLNNLGQVVGSGSLGGASAPNAFLWDSGSMTYLGDLAGGVERSEAFAINDFGQVVGRGNSDIASSRAVLWENGSTIDLGDLVGGGRSGWAYDINNSASIVGQSSSSPTILATQWKDGNIIDIGTPPPIFPSGSSANGINTSGQIVGNASLGSGGSSRAVLWNTNGSVINLGAIGINNDVSQANDINNVGQIVGSSKIDVGSGFATHAALWDNGSIIDLGDLSATKEVRSEATAINDNGQVVGWSRLSSGSRAVLWDGNSIFDLNDLLDATDPLSAETTLLRAFDINESGQIVGQALFDHGINQSGFHGFLLTPVVVPVPPAVWLFSSGLLGLIGVSRYKRVS